MATHSKSQLGRPLFVLRHAVSFILFSATAALADALKIFHQHLISEIMGDAAARLRRHRLHAVSSEVKACIDGCVINDHRS
jgi:hypothetical protein